MCSAGESLLIRDPTLWPYLDFRPEHDRESGIRKPNEGRHKLHTACARGQFKSVGEALCALHVNSVWWQS